MNTFAVVGCGGLGARHVQALSRTKQPLSVWAVDTAATALAACKDIIEKTADRNPKSEFHYAPDISDLPKKIDFAIIATTARPRLGALKALLSGRSVEGLLLEKILFSRLSEYDECEEMMGSGFPLAWVNTNMPMIPAYGNFKPHVKEGPVALNVVGGNIRIASNLIHYIDYVHFLSGVSDYEIDIDPRCVTLVDNKRAGYKDLEGEAYARFRDGSSIHVSTRQDASVPFQTQVAGKDAVMITRDREAKTWMLRRENNWAWDEMATPYPFQSNLTTDLAHQFLDKKTLPLTDLATSIKLHRPLVEALLAVSGPDVLPFT